MTNFTSRLLVAAVGLPLVLGMLWLGGWWLFTLLAVAACIGVHEFVTTARPLRPLAPAVYGGALLALLGAEMGGVVWLLGGFLATFVLTFLLHAISSTRAPTTAAVGSTTDEDEAGLFRPTASCIATISSLCVTMISCASRLSCSLRP